MPLPFSVASSHDSSNLAILSRTHFEHLFALCFVTLLTKCLTIFYHSHHKETRCLNSFYESHCLNKFLNGSFFVCLTSTDPLDVNLSATQVHSYHCYVLHSSEINTNYIFSLLHLQLKITFLLWSLQKPSILRIEPNISLGQPPQTLQSLSLACINNHFYKVSSHKWKNYAVHCHCNVT